MVTWRSAKTCRETGEGQVALLHKGAAPGRAANGFVFRLGSLCARVCQLADQRLRRGVRYSLAFVLTVMALARLTGADNPQAIADWVSELAALSVKTFELNRSRMPRHHTYRRFPQRAVLPEAWEKAATDFLSALPQTGPLVQLSRTARRCAAQRCGERRAACTCWRPIDPRSAWCSARSKWTSPTRSLAQRSGCSNGWICRGKSRRVMPCTLTAVVAAGGRGQWGLNLDLQGQPAHPARRPEQLFALDLTRVKGFNTGPTHYHTAQQWTRSMGVSRRAG